jgi:hypothetical protein
LSENGRFVSRPVEALAQPHEASSPSSPAWPDEQYGQYAATGASRAPRLSRTVPGLAAPTQSRQPHYSALAVTLGTTLATTRAAHVSEPLPQPEAARPMPPPLPTAALAPPAVRASAPARRSRGGRLFWKVLTAFGVLLLAFVLWLAFFPGALRLLPEMLKLNALQS